MRLFITAARHFFVALAFFTRLPIPSWVGFAADDLDRAAPWFPVVGLLVGSLVAALFWLAQCLFPLRVALVLSLIFSVMLTGAFHEDGLADSVDAFGGAFDRENVLRIMQDSRIGTFGAVALILALGLKLELLAAMPVADIVLLLPVAHGASRWLSGSLLWDMQYVRPQGKAKPLATRMRTRALLLSALPGLLPLLLLGWRVALLSLLVLLAGRLLYCAWLRRRLGGYTGDTLGMAQQFAELLIYMVWVAWLYS